MRHPRGTERAVSTSETISSILVRLRLFASSYAPLWAITALLQETWWVAASFVLLAVAGALSAVLILVDVHRLEPDPYRIQEVSDRGAEVAGYLATYLLPFIMVSNPSGRELVSYALFLLVIAVVYLQSNMLAINPLLYLLGFRVTVVTTSTGSTAYLISRSTPERGEVVLAAELAEGVLVATRDRR
jgi:hypothetical protein